MTTVGGKNFPRCAKAVCSGTTSITFTYAGGKTCTCTSNGGAASCSDGTYSATCPANIANFCTSMTSANSCPSDCSGRGLCLGSSGSKSCFCVYGWKGDDCNTENTDETDAMLTPQKIKKSIIYSVTALIWILALVTF